jgi:aminopeptidase N
MSARYRLLLGVAMLLPFAMTTAGEPSRFAVRGELQPSASSDDGRFRLRAEARVTPEAKSADGRFALKSTNASCDPLDTDIFEDGFET